MPTNFSASALCFDPMAKRGAHRIKTDQINFRLPVDLIERMERYREAHPLHPTLTRIVIASVAEWLSRAERESVVLQHRKRP